MICELKRCLNILRYCKEISLEDLSESDKYEYIMTVTTMYELFKQMERVGIQDGNMGGFIEYFEKIENIFDEYSFYQLDYEENRVNLTQSL